MRIATELWGLFLLVIGGGMAIAGIIWLVVTGQTALALVIVGVVAARCAVPLVFREPEPPGVGEGWTALRVEPGRIPDVDEAG